jgi:hypothetical protein
VIAPNHGPRDCKRSVPIEDFTKTPEFRIFAYAGNSGNVQVRVKYKEEVEGIKKDLHPFGIIILLNQLF